MFRDLFKNVCWVCIAIALARANVLIMNGWKNIIMLVGAGAVRNRKML